MLSSMGADKPEETTQLQESFKKQNTMLMNI
jgi:hypothetical protein